MHYHLYYLLVYPILETTRDKINAYPTFYNELDFFLACGKADLIVESSQGKDGIQSSRLLLQKDLKHDLIAKFVAFTG